ALGARLQCVFWPLRIVLLGFRRPAYVKILGARLANTRELVGHVVDDDEIIVFVDGDDWTLARLAIIETLAYCVPNLAKDVRAVTAVLWRNFLSNGHSNWGRQEPLINVRDIYAVHPQEADVWGLTIHSVWVIAHQEKATAGLWCAEKAVPAEDRRA